MPSMVKIKPGGKFFVYILKCRDNTFYTGYTPDLARRVKTHNESKGAKYTRSRLPVKLVWSKCCKSKSAAMSAEVKIKQLTRKEKDKLVGAGQYRGGVKSSVSGSETTKM